jgi:FkbM family methyltransferase
MCGHATVITVHERLDIVDRQLSHILAQNVHSAQNQTALLQSGVHLVEALPRLEFEIQQVEMRLASLVRDHCAAKRDLEAATGQMERTGRELNRAFTNIAAANAQVLAGHMEGLGQRLDDAASNVDRQLAQILDQNIHSAQNQTALLQSGVHLVETLPRIQSEVQQVEVRLASLVLDHCAAKRDLETATGQMDRQLSDILAQNVHSAQNQTALLQSGAHLVETLPRIRSEVQQVEMRLASLVRDHCAAKPDLQAAIGQMERIRRESNHAFAKIAAANEQELAEHLEVFGQRLDDAVSNTRQGLCEEMESARQRLENAASNLAAANAQELAGHLAGFGQRLDDAASNTRQGLHEGIESMQQRIDVAASNLAAANAQAMQEKIEIVRQWFDALTNLAAANAQELAGHLAGFGQRLDDAASNTRQGLHEGIESTQQRIDVAASNLAAANAQAMQEKIEIMRQWFDALTNLAAASAQAMHEDFGSMRQRLDNAASSLATANAEAQETGLAVLRPTLAGVLNLEREYAATRASVAFLEPVARETSSFLANETVRQVCVETSEYATVNPELGLMSFLYSHLPGRNALDIGAHTGEVSDWLLKTGYEVYAFEPYPPNYTRLSERLKEHPAFHSFNLALGAVDGELPLFLVDDSTDDKRYDDPTVFNSLARHGMPEGLSFHETIQVQVKRLSGLHKSGVVPAKISLVKIDTEGYDLEVIRGMDGHRYPVVCVEFWDTRIPFADNGLLYTVESMVREMLRRDYPWYILIYRVWGQNQTAFFCNHDQPVPGSWGNIFFFRDRDTFQQAQQWCAAVLPRTYFKPVPARQAATQ